MANQTKPQISITSFVVHNDGSTDIFFEWNDMEYHVYSNVKQTEQWANNRGHLSGYDYEGSGYEISFEGFMESEVPLENDVQIDLVKFIAQDNYKSITKLTK